MERKGKRITNITLTERVVLGMGYHKSSLRVRRVPGIINRLYEQATARIHAQDAINMERYGSLPAPDQDPLSADTEIRDQIRVAEELRSLLSDHEQEMLW
jgi:hypothetical protein